MTRPGATLTLDLTSDLMLDLALDPALDLSLDLKLRVRVARDGFVGEQLEGLREGPGRAGGVAIEVGAGEPWDEGRS